MTVSEWHTVHGKLMTSEPIEAYGGLSIPAALLNSLARKLNTGGIPWHLDHDLSKPIRMRNIKAFVETRDDGIDELRFQGELHKGDLHWLESRPGISATLTSPLARDEHAPSNEAATIRISADHAWFADEALIEAEKLFLARGVSPDLIQVERAFQFSFMPDPQIFVDIAYTVLIALAPNAAWDGIKKLFSLRKTPAGGDPNSPTVINVSISDGDRSLQASVTTDDETVAQRAIESLDKAATAFFQAAPFPPAEADSKPITVWNEKNRSWTPPA